MFVWFLKVICLIRKAIFYFEGKFLSHWAKIKVFGFLGVAQKIILI